MTANPYTDNFQIDGVDIVINMIDDRGPTDAPEPDFMRFVAIVDGVKIKLSPAIAVNEEWGWITEYLRDEFTNQIIKASHQSKKDIMKIKRKDLIDLLDHIGTQSVYITDDHNAEMEDDLGKKEVKRMDKLFKKLHKQLDKKK